MNPWLEEFWRDVHAKFLVYACDFLNAELPAGLHLKSTSFAAAAGHCLTARY